jgi:hypothetical protein
MSRRVVVNVPFDEEVWGFKSDYPEELSPVLERDEWTAISNRISADLNRSLVEHWSNIKKWIRCSEIATLTLVGSVSWFVVIYKIDSHRRLLRQYWKSVRKYLKHLSEQDVRRGRRLQWRLALDEQRANDEESETMVPDYCRCIAIEWSR